MTSFLNLVGGRLFAVGDNQIVGNRVNFFSCAGNERCGSGTKIVGRKDEMVKRTIGDFFARRNRAPSRGHGFGVWRLRISPAGPAFRIRMYAVHRLPVQLLRGWRLLRIAVLWSVHGLQRCR